MTQIVRVEAVLITSLQHHHYSKAAVAENVAASRGGR